MADPYLQLTLGSLTVLYQGYIFEDGQLPRTVDEDLVGTIEYSLNGGVYVTGAAVHPKHLWTFSIASLLDQGLSDQTRELWSEYNRLRLAGSDPRMTLEDTSQYFFEASRTRALATNASEINTTTGVKYYAKFYVYFERPPVFERGEGFTIQLKEGAIFPS
ncbi:MAG: hypothetical protein F6K11_18135 [Leptolyngbya sp. SIO3F4]|nr:hypothetical protein [Leptolyngbya sp. SIO3F4]